MAGDNHISEVVAYLSRMLGEAITADQPLQLRSVHRAAFASWIRKQMLPARLAVTASGARFTVRDLFQGDNLTPISTTHRSEDTSHSFISTMASPITIGIDIEDVDSLPEAEDYREHPFYTDNFSPSEMSYCIRQSNVRASFCGTWAAKEAIIKAGRAASPTNGLKTIEISRDSAGRPSYPNCQISISHTPRTAAAVCVMLQTVGPVTTLTPLQQSLPVETTATPAIYRPLRIGVSKLAYAAAIICGGAVCVALLILH